MASGDRRWQTVGGSCRTDDPVADIVPDTPPSIFADRFAIAFPTVSSPSVRVEPSHHANPFRHRLRTAAPLPQQPRRVDLRGAQRRNERRRNADNDQEHSDTAISNSVVRPDLVQNGRKPVGAHGGHEDAAERAQ